MNESKRLGKRFLLVIVALSVIGLCGGFYGCGESSSDSSNAPSSQNSSSGAKSNGADNQETPGASAATLTYSGKGRTSTKSQKITQEGTYQITYNLKNNISSYGSGATNFIVSLKGTATDDHPFDNLSAGVNEIEKKGTWSTTAELSEGSLYFNVEASTKATWTIKVEPK
jgi:hypothetical protein